MRDTAFPRRATLRDVAALAGVSTKTASRVVNGEPGVSAAKVEAVRLAVTQLDYRRDMAASALRRGDGRTAVIAAILEDIANPFSAEVHRALENEALEHGVLIVAGSVDRDPRREWRLVREFVARRVDALVVMPASHHQDYLHRDVPPSMPVVFVDRTPSGFEADAVVTDNAESAAAAAGHLVEHGHRRIAVLTDHTTIPTARDRRAGFMAEMASRGLVVPPTLVASGLDTDAEVAAAMGAMLDLAEPPTAVFAAQNLLTIGVVRYLQHAGLSDRIALIGFDDVPWADLVKPGISVMAQDPREMGLRVARIAFARLAGDQSPPRVEVVPSRLLPRGSGRAPSETSPALRRGARRPKRSGAPPLGPTRAARSSRRWDPAASGASLNGFRGRLGSRLTQ